jgi:hypothetical protein
MAPLNGKSIPLDGREQDKIVTAIRKQRSITTKAPGRAMGCTEGQGSNLTDLDGAFDVISRDRVCVEPAEAATEFLAPSLVVLSLRWSCIGEGWHTLPRCMIGTVHAPAASNTAKASSKAAVGTGAQTLHRPRKVHRTINCGRILGNPGWLIEKPTSRVDMIIVFREVVRHELPKFLNEIRCLAF